MNRRNLGLLVGFAVVALLGWGSAQLPALRSIADEPKDEAKPKKPCDVAVLDVSRVFKEHREFKKRMEELKTKLTDFQAYGKEKEAALRLSVELLKLSLKEGTEAYEQEEKRVRRVGTDLQQEGEAMQKRLMKEEAEVYHQIYVGVHRTTASYAKLNGIRAVLKFNSDPVDPSDRNSILMGVNNPIVYQDQLDITAEIIRLVNETPDKS